MIRGQVTVHLVNLVVWCDCVDLMSWEGGVIECVNHGLSVV